MNEHVGLTPPLAAALEEVKAGLPAAVHEDLWGDPGFFVCDVDSVPGRAVSVPVAAPGFGRPGRCVVLKRSLARREAAFVRWVIAHELAHAYLRNEGRTPAEDPEAAADALAAAWGFPRPGGEAGVWPLPVIRPPQYGVEGAVEPG